MKAKLKTQNSKLKTNKLAACGSSFIEGFSSSSRIALFWLAFLSIASVMMFTNCTEEMEPKEESKKVEKKEDKKKDKQDDPVVVVTNSMATNSIVTTPPVVVAKTNLEYVTTIGTGSAVTHPANTGFNKPYGLDVANGKLYVLDSYNYRVQVYTNLSGTPAVENTITGGFDEPSGVTVANGKLYVADTLNHRVQIYTNLSGTPTYLDTIGTGSSVNHPANTGFNLLYGVAVANGKLYVADTGNNRVQVYGSLSGTPAYEKTIGSGSRVTHPANTGFKSPYGVTVADSKLYVADYGNDRVQVYGSLSGTPTVENTIGTGSRVNQPANTGFYQPYGVTIANGKLYVADTSNDRVQVYGSLSGTPTVENTIGIGSRVTNNTGFTNPYGVAVDGDKVYVLDTFNQRIQVYEWRP